MCVCVCVQMLVWGYASKWACLCIWKAETTSGVFLNGCVLTWIVWILPVWLDKEMQGSTPPLSPIIQWLQGHTSTLSFSWMLRVEPYLMLEHQVLYQLSQLHSAWLSVFLLCIQRFPLLWKQCFGYREQRVTALYHLSLVCLQLLCLLDSGMVESLVLKTAVCIAHLNFRGRII